MTIRMLEATLLAVYLIEYFRMHLNKYWNEIYAQKETKKNSMFRLLVRSRAVIAFSIIAV